MFYFASDNPLAPEVVSQLKAIKQAGFHDQVNVIAQFDPNVGSRDTHIFDVNRINKVNFAEPRIGFVGHSPDDPYVVNLMIDKVWRQEGEEEKIRRNILESLERADENRRAEFARLKPLRANLEAAPSAGDETEDSESEPGPNTSLPQFLSLCAESYPADHYVLFIIGHGLIVGNDTFLFDENASEQSLKLTELGKILGEFKIKVAEQKAEFELVSFHSCSMSSLEVAYELQYEVDGHVQVTANYMLAAQGFSFVGSWPYRQILIRIFNHVQGTASGPRTVKELFRDIFYYCLYNSYDFIVAGYAFDACLCDLNRVSETQGAISELSRSLKDGLLSDPRIKDGILLAHLDAQSFWLENYVDLFDFCRRVRLKLKPLTEGLEPDQIPKAVKDITDACAVVEMLFRRGDRSFDDLLVVRSEFAGAASQYAHGLSVFLPWAPPVEDTFWPRQYGRYRFSKAFEGSAAWTDFLKTYFEETRRRPRSDRENDETDAAEDGSAHKRARGRRRRPRGRLRLQEVLLERFASSVFDRGGQLAKGGPTDSQGDDCDCPSIKNFPAFTREPKRGGGTSERKIEVDGTLVGGILNEPNALAQSDGHTFIFDLDSAD